MNNYEVLVHIAAPSGFRDDKRYRAQAEAIAKFEAAAVTNIYGGSEEVIPTSRNASTDDSTASLATFSDERSDIVKETPIQQRKRYLLSKIGGLPDSTAPESVPATRWQITKSHTANKQNLRPDLNPPYKNPLLNQRFQQSTIQAVRTSDASRPKTAVADDVSLPASNSFTGWTTRKRARSESSSFNSVVPETQQATTTAINSSGSSTQYIPSSDPSEKQDRAVMKHTQKADDKGALRKRVCLGEVSTLGMDATTDLSTGQSEGQMPSYFLRDRSLDWTSSPEPSSSGDTKTSTTPTATATPSQLLPEMPRQSRSEATPKVKEEYTYHNPTSPINLISQDLQSTPPERSTSLSPQPAIPSSPAAMTPTPRSPISTLSTHIFPPPPPTGHGIYVTHITPVLALTVKRLPIAKWFRPVQVSRDVHVLERGHWRIPITIASQAVVDEARTEVLRDQKLAKITKQHDAPTRKEKWEKKRLSEETRIRGRDLGLGGGPPEYGEYGELLERKRQDMWTEEEFVRFWGNLEECVGEGKWGWGVKVFREEYTEEADEVRKPHDDLPSSPPGADAVRAEREKERRVLLKVTTWGELIPHIWILLWLMSDKLTAYIPMEWRAGDDSIVVKMSGHRRKHGILGEWVYKGPEGERGVWGIAGAKAIEHGEPSKA
jgi:hypothetical protein